jgi:hypothetical protein
MLCRVCWAKTLDALSRVENLIVHLRSIEKMAQAVGERVDTTMEKRLILPETWMAADSLLDALGQPPIPSTASIDNAFALARDAVAAWADAEAIVQTREGAKRAVVLVKRMNMALKRWPDSEVGMRRIPYLACPICHLAHLWRKGPVEEGDELIVMCGTDYGYPPELGYNCRFTADWFEWLDKYGPVITALFKEIDRGGNPVGKEAA